MNLWEKGIDIKKEDRNSEREMKKQTDIFACDLKFKLLKIMRNMIRNKMSRSCSLSRKLLPIYLRVVKKKTFKSLTELS